MNILHEINRLLELAKSVKDESIFQKKYLYKKFRAANNIINSDHEKDIIHLANELFDLQYYRECIFWDTKLIEITKIRNKELRFQVLNQLKVCYFSLNHFTKALDYGQKSIELGGVLNKPFSEMFKLVYFMKLCSVQLPNHIDAMNYGEECLNILNIQNQTNKINELDLLIAYSDLIKLKLEYKEYSRAKKTIIELKLFNLYSDDIMEVMRVLNLSEEFKSIFPLHKWKNQLNNFNAIVQQTEFRRMVTNLRENWSISENFEHCVRKFNIYFRVGELCWQKYLISRDLEGETHDIRWGKLTIEIIKNILLNLSLLDDAAQTQYVGLKRRNAGYLNASQFFSALFNYALKLADVDPVDKSSRQKLFSYVYDTIIHGYLTTKWPFWYEICPNNMGSFCPVTLRKIWKLYSIQL